MRLNNRIDELAERIEGLIEKAELWQLLFDESPDAIALFDKNLRFFMVNKAFSQLTNFESIELVGKKIDLVLPRELKKPHKAWSDAYTQNPVKKSNRHGLSPVILTKERKSIPVGIDLSFFHYRDDPYYTAFIRKL